MGWTVKTEWSPKKNPESPCDVNVPDTLERAGFIAKNSKRFPEANGGGCAVHL
jgi:hypothetical protein